MHANLDQVSPILSSSLSFGQKAAIIIVNDKQATSHQKKEKNRRAYTHPGPALYVFVSYFMDENMKKTQSFKLQVKHYDPYNKTTNI